MTTEFLRGCAVEGVETNPETVGMGTLDQGAQAVCLFGRPFSGIRLARRLDYSPRVIPPAAVVVCFFRVEDFGRCLRVLVLGVNRAE